MSLGIYTSADPAAILSQDGAHTNDFLLSFNGKYGGTIQKLLYLRNDNIGYYYGNISLSMSSSVNGATYLDNSIGYSWKLREGVSQPTDQEWALIAHDNTATFDDIGTNSIPDNSNYHAFWVKVVVPRNANVRTFTDIRFVLFANENIVT